MSAIRNCPFPGFIVRCSSSYPNRDKRQRNGFYPLDVFDKLEETTMTNIDAYMTKKIAAGKNNGCMLEKAGVRRE
jgi:tyrosinase